jgi:hypothetical protein
MDKIQTEPSIQRETHFTVQASVGNADGVFDAAYDFGSENGQEAEMSGTPQEIGESVARYLSRLSSDDCETMKYGTPRFFVQFVIEPESTPNGA